MVILGLDPGIATTGYGVISVSGSSLRMLTTGVIRTSPRTPHAARLAAIFTAISGLVAETNATHASVEEVFAGPDLRGVIALGQARGAALAACGQAGMPVAEYPVSVIKTAVCGYGRAEKGQVARMVRMILRLERDVRTEHEADALAAAICHAQRARIGQLAGSGA